MATRTRPDLETGWQPTTPPDDSVLRQGALTLSASWEAIATAGGGRVHADERFTAVDLGRPTGLFNSATLLQPPVSDDFDRTLDAIERFYDEGGRGTAMLWSPWPTPDLVSRGWDLQGHPPLLHRPAGAGDVRHRVPTDLTLTEVTSRDAFEDWCAVAVEAFPFDDVAPPRSLLDERVLDDGRFRFVLGHADGRAVAIGCQFVEHRTNLLLLAATRREARGRGFYAAIASDRLAHRPQLPAVAVVSDDSRPVLVDRLGFTPITRFTLWSRPRP